MENRNLEKAVMIVSKLIHGEEISKNGANVALYEEYTSNSEVYDTVMMITRNFNLNLYEYNYTLFVTAKENNRVFGFSNEELKRLLGLRLNRELFLCYLIIYNIMTLFYNDSANYTYLESTTVAEIIDSVNACVTGINGEKEIFSKSEEEENGFKSICFLWQDMPSIAGEDTAQIRASRNSRAGYVKLVLNFLIMQNLFLEEGDRYYPRDKFRAMVENYFEEYRGQLYSIINDGEEE